MSGLCGIGLGEYFFLQFMRTLNKSHLQEQISNAEVAVHAGDHEGRAEVPFDAVHVHLFFGGYFLLIFFLHVYLQPRSQLGHDVQVAHASRQDQGCESIFVG